MVITNKGLPGRGFFCSLFCLSGDDKTSKQCSECDQRHDEPGGRLVTNVQRARTEIYRRREFTITTEAAVSKGGTEQFDFGDRSLLGGEGNVTEVGPEHLRLGAELHALIHAVVASIVMAGECFAVIILVMIVLVVVAAAIVAQVVGFAGLTFLEDVEGVVPGRNISCQVTDAAAIVIVVAIVVVVAIVIICVHVLDDLNRIQVSGMLNRTRRVSIETERHTALRKGHHVVVDGVPIFVGLVRLGATTGPGLTKVLHFFILIFGPDADALVLVELFHPLVVVRLLEQAEELEVGIGEVTVVHFAAAILRDAGGLVPLAGVAIEELILTNALSCVVKVNILRRRSERWLLGKEVAYVCMLVRSAERR